MLRNPTKSSGSKKQTIKPLHKSKPTTLKTPLKKKPQTTGKRFHAGCGSNHHHDSPAIATTTTTTTPPSADGDSHTATGEDVPGIRQTLSKDPTQRFAARNAFIRKRHTEKDHLIHTHHNDLRLFSCNLTNTLRTAVQKHKMTRLEAEIWGGYASGTALYAGLLRGNDRIIMESFLNNKEGQTNHIYVEAFAVGEIRGFSSIKNHDITEHGEHPGTGVIRLTKAIHQHRRKYNSTLPATGDPMQDWQQLYTQSEQIPTYVQTETVLHEDPETGEVIVDFCGASLVQVLGGDATESERVRVLSEKRLRRLEDETEHQYIKRVQLSEYRDRVVDEDMPAIVKEYGSAGYLSRLLGIDPDTLGRPENMFNAGNTEKVFDWELFERSLLQSSLRDKPLAHMVDNNGITIAEPATQEGKFQYSMEYRPLQFFCRCYQTDTHGKLMSLPKDLLVSLTEDEIVTFTCDFCSNHDDISREQVQRAVDEKTEMERKVAEEIAQQQSPAVPTGGDNDAAAPVVAELADKNAATQH